MTKTIEISEELYKKVSTHCEASGQPVGAFVEQVVVAALTQGNTPVYQQHDEEEIKERLKSLGYID